MVLTQWDVASFKNKHQQRFATRFIDTTFRRNDSKLVHEQERRGDWAQRVNEMLHLNQDVLAFFYEWKMVLLAIAAVGAAGLAAGLFYRVGAAIVLALATMISGIYLGIGNGWAIWQSILYAIGLLTVLQLAYLLGAGLSVTVSRASSRASLRTLIAGLFKQKTAR